MSDERSSISIGISVNPRVRAAGRDALRLLAAGSGDGDTLASELGTSLTGFQAETQDELLECLVELTFLVAWFGGSGIAAAADHAEIPFANVLERIETHFADVFNRAGIPHENEPEGDSP